MVLLFFVFCFWGGHISWWRHLTGRSRMLKKQRKMKGRSLLKLLVLLRAPVITQPALLSDSWAPRAALISLGRQYPGSMVPLMVLLRMKRTLY